MAFLCHNRYQAVFFIFEERPLLLSQESALAQKAAHAHPVRAHEKTKEPLGKHVS